MFEHRFSRAIALCCLVLSGCGGGSSGSSGTTDTPTFGAVFNVASVDAVGVAGTPQPVSLSAALSYTASSNPFAGGTSGLFLAVDSDSAVVLDVHGQVSGNVLNLAVTLRGDLAVSTYPSELLLHACLDDLCTREAIGSPVHLPVRYVVKPNLQVQQQVTLSRSGSDTAPSVSLPVTVPAEAGTVVMQTSNSRPDAIGLSFDGNQLQVQTQQVQAGTYSAKATLRSTVDPRYSRAVDIQYTVLAPPGGEQVLSAGDPSPSITIQQGSQSVQHLIVTRPTWTSAWDAPQIVGDTGNLLTLVDRGIDHYDVTINAAGAPLGQYSATVVFSAGATGGTAAVRFSIFVSGVFYLSGDLVRTLTATSTPSDLIWSNPVLTFDGFPANWTAVSMSPSLHVLRASGQIGVDALQLALDPATLTLPDPGLALFVQVSLDRPGTSPVTFQYSVWNQIPTLQRISPATLVGDSGRIYIEGVIQQYGGLLESGRLHVSGATLAGAQIITDSRFVGDVSILAVDVAGASPGTPVTFSVDSSLLPTQVQMQVMSPLRAAAGYQALPFGSYRPGQFAPGLGALYFSAPGTAYRWAYSAGTWSMSQSNVPELIDVAPAPDDTALFASDPGHVMALDPVTLAQQSVGALQSNFLPTADFDPVAMPGSRALVFSADGRALGSISDRNLTQNHGVGWICAFQTGRLIPALTALPGKCDPGIQQSADPAPSGFGLVRSANGYFIEAAGPGGEHLIYRPEQRRWVGVPKLAGGLTLAAVSDSGSRVVRSDGMLLDGSDNQLGNLASVVPFTHAPGGYGLSSGGRFGVVYGYRLSGMGSAQAATDATVWVVDLNDAANTGVTSAPVIGTIALPQAVGCTSALAAGETCQHTASITVAPGDATAFVLGPRGVAAVPLPMNVSPAASLSSARLESKAASRPHTKVQSRPRGIFVPRPASR